MSPVSRLSAPRLGRNAEGPERLSSEARLVAFIDANKDDVVDGRRLGVELIRRLLQVAPSSYYAAKTRAPSARALRDEELIPQLVELWEANYRVSGVRKLWEAAPRAGIMIGRDQTARPMRVAGIEGARRSKRVKTTRPDPASARHHLSTGRLLQLPFAAERGGCRAWFRNCAGDERTTRRNAVLNALSDR